MSDQMVTPRAFFTPPLSTVQLRFIASLEARVLWTFKSGFTYKYSFVENLFFMNLKLILNLLPKCSVSHEGKNDCTQFDICNCFICIIRKGYKFSLQHLGSRYCPNVLRPFHKALRHKSRENVAWRKVLFNLIK